MMRIEGNVARRETGENESSPAHTTASRGTVSYCVTPVSCLHSPRPRLYAGDLSWLVLSVRASSVRCLA